MSNLIQSPYPIFTDIDGDPIEDGYILIGVAGKDPLTDPLDVYWDEEMTLPATNIRTKGGYPLNGTAPGRLYTAAPYSITVNNKRNETVYSRESVYTPPSNYYGGSIETTDILIPVNGTVDSQNNRSIQKKISWNPYKSWKTTGITGDLRFPRGEAGVFGAYENLILDQSWTDQGTAVSSDVGNWKQITSGATPTTAYLLSNTFTLTGAFYALFAIEVERVDAAITDIQLNAIGAHITWSTQTITYDSDCTQLKASWKGTETVVLYFWVDSASASRECRIYPDKSNTNKSVRFKDMMVVDYASVTPYPVPYVKGTHTADSWVHPVNWNESTSWTIDMWFKPESIEAQYLFDSRGESGTDGLTILGSAGDYYARAYSGGANTTAVFSTPPTVGQYSHIKAVYVSGASFNVYLNGLLVSTVSTNIPTYSLIPPTTTIGSTYTLASHLQGYISDLMIRPTADVTTDHYTLGLPWTNPENPINTIHGAYVDKFGNYAGESFTGLVEDVYSVVKQYTEGTETVIKWSNGNMRHIESAGSEADSGAYTFIEPFKTISSVQVTCTNDSTTAIVNVKTPTITGYTIRTNAAPGTYTEVSDGTWK